MLNEDVLNEDVLNEDVLTRRRPKGLQGNGQL